MHEGHVSVLEKWPEDGHLAPLLGHLSGKRTMW